MNTANNSITQCNPPCGPVWGFPVSERVTGFYGIPYAAAPVGNLRWKDAAPIDPWTEPLDCTVPLTKQKSAIQWGEDLLAYFRTLNASEDCLYLNVSTPSTDCNASLPVMVWFHGGGLFAGSGSEEIYNLPLLPAKGCVLVAVTTRLGALGMLSADVLGSSFGAADSGNFIISDMLAALQWVQTNISAFGGSPENVTIAGESGGAQKVHALMTVPSAKGLFHRAIMQSGVAAAMSFEEAKQIGNTFFDKLGVSNADEARDIPVERLLEVYNEMKLFPEFIMDGYYLQQAPIDAVEAGHYHGCNCIMGVNAGEIDNLLMVMGGIPNYSRLLRRFTQDGHKAYVYCLDQVPGSWRSLGFQCVHSLDLAYLFGEHEDIHRFYNGGPWEQQFLFHNAAQRLDPAKFISPQMDLYDCRLSEAIMDMWVSFMSTGQPAAEWAPYSQSGEEYYYLSCSASDHAEMRTKFSSLYRVQNDT